MRVLSAHSVQRCILLKVSGSQLPALSTTDPQKLHYSTKYTNNERSYFKHGIFMAASVGITWGIYNYIREQKKNLLADSALKTCVGLYKKGLPEYSTSEIVKHDNKVTGIWVTYANGVYDITKFVDKHPGGDKILMAAGGALEPFWLLYAVHNQESVLQLLEEYRIGNLSADEERKPTDNMADPYANEPKRHPSLKSSSKKPFNAETPLSLLVDSFLTPSDLFYVRNHLPVPDVDPKTYELEICGPEKEVMSLSLDDLKTKFKKHTITATVHCAGNRRSEMAQVKPIKGLSWSQGAVGNATWSGAKLSDVLRKYGYADQHIGGSHVQFEGLDTDVTNSPYGASIPYEKAIDPKNDVLLAYEMNGKPLSRDHGFPLRVVVPGVVGARHVKWLGRIIVSHEESESQWQRRDYKGFSPNVDWDNVDFDSSPAIQEYPVTSAICYPQEGQHVKLVNGCVVIKGYAWSGGGQKIIRVDITADGGKTWHTAEITDEDDNAKSPHNWSWSLWKAEIPVKPGTKKLEIWAKAVDTSYNTQPESFQNIWNLRGVISNAYHKVKVCVEN